MKDTAFSVSGERIDRLATAYERDNAATGEPVVEDGHDGRWSRPPASRLSAEHRSPGGATHR